MSAFFDAPEGLIRIPPGHVRLGQEGVPYAEPVHDIWVDGFWICACEVTNGEYEDSIDAGGYAAEDYWHPLGWAWRSAGNISVPLNRHSSE